MKRFLPVQLSRKGAPRDPGPVVLHRSALSLWLAALLAGSIGLAAVLVMGYAVVGGFAIWTEPYALIAALLAGPGMLAIAAAFLRQSADPTPALVISATGVTVAQRPLFRRAKPPVELPWSEITTLQHIRMHRGPNQLKLGIRSGRVHTLTTQFLKVSHGHLLDLLAYHARAAGRSITRNDSQTALARITTLQLKPAGD